MDPSDFDADPDPDQMDPDQMDPDFQRRMPDPDPDADPDNKFMYMTMAFFPDFLYCRD